MVYKLLFNLFCEDKNIWLCKFSNLHWDKSQETNKILVSAKAKVNLFSFHLKSCQKCRDEINVIFSG